MGVSVYKGILKYQCLEAGWSELYWLKGPDATAAFNQLLNINQARMPLSMADVKLVDAVTIDAGNPLVSFHPDRTVGGWVSAGTYAGATATTVTPDLAILIRTYSADDLRRSRLFLRGFPADQFATGAGGPDALFTFITAYNTALNAYLAALGTNTQMVHRTAPHMFTLAPVGRATASTSAHLRRAGRPFNLRRGRRQIA